MCGLCVPLAFCCVSHSVFPPIGSAYVGVRNLPLSHPLRDQSNQIVLQQEISDAGPELEVLRSGMAQRDTLIADLRHQVDRQSQVGKQELLQQRSDLNQRLETAESKTQGLLDKLHSLEPQAPDDKQRSIALEAKLTDLNRLLRDREATIDRSRNS